MSNSNMNIGDVYFWTNTIKDWKPLLEKDDFKNIIIEQLLWLKEREKIVVYGFVIMPNHMHIMWEMLDMNGKEKPHASFNKWTSSQFLKALRIQNPELLPQFVERTTERNHRFWQRNALAVLMDSKAKVEQKLNYMHLNPLQEHWNLAKAPEHYKWSSSRFYETGEDEFDLLTHYMDRF